MQYNIKPKINTKQDFVDKLSEIRSLLPHGSQKRIHEETGISNPTISRVLAGNARNNAVMEAAMRIINEENALLKTEIEKMNKIINGNK